jgi:glycine C-acetyltransferase
MGKQNFFSLLQSEITRIDTAKTAKRFEKVITGYTKEKNPRAIINGRRYSVFNSNDYLGLRHHPLLKKAEHAASEKLGTGPGAVRFISGTTKIHQDLEKALAKFQRREAAMVFSSAFAANNAVLFCLLKGQSKDSLVKDKVLVISDALNHRSIIDGVRLANLDNDQKQIFKHLDSLDLERLLKENIGRFDRVVVVTDGVFSMLGEYQNLKELKTVIDKYDQKYINGIILVADDSHGIGACGETGRGVEEIYKTKADLLVSTLGKGLGADGGYVVGSQVMIDYLRESSATYIYSNSIAPGTAGAALAAINLLAGSKGLKLLKSLRKNIAYFKKLTSQAKIPLAVNSTHPIQPVLIGDPGKTKTVVAELFKKGILATAISYPVVPTGRDEIRVQLSATHTKTDLEFLVKQLSKVI